MICENDDCCNCHKDVPVMVFGAADISEGCRLIKCQGRQKIARGEGGENDLYLPENL